ncbi:MAG: sigma-70 family RNA polymerase sigma factor [Spirochaetes bacterium]|nr:sigma-70 family RNA polymerase sigma factor [Spirochaetota bacterium]
MNRSDCRETQGDDALIREFQQGNVDIFPLLIQRHMQIVFNLCHRIMGDYDDANDCAQETFVKIYRHLHTFKFRSSFDTWIYRIAVNTCRNSISSRHFKFRKKTVSLDNDPEGTRLPRQVGDRRSDPQVQMEREEERKAIMEALRSLPGDLRILIILRDMEERPYEEIADICGMKTGTVKSRLSRARHMLRDRLRGAL